MTENSFSVCRYAGLQKKKTTLKIINVIYVACSISAGSSFSLVEINNAKFTRPAVFSGHEITRLGMGVSSRPKTVAGNRA